MDNDTVDRQPEAGQRQPAPVPPACDSKTGASMQFVHRLVEGWRTEHAYPIIHARLDLWPRKKAPAVASGQQRIARAPGFGLVGLLKFFCRTTTAQRVIEPMHAEFLVEYFAALQEGGRLRAGYIRLMMYAYLVKAVLTDRIVELIGSIVSGRVKARPDK